MNMFNSTITLRGSFVSLDAYYQEAESYFMASLPEPPMGRVWTRTHEIIQTDIMNMINVEREYILTYLGNFVEQKLVPEYLAPESAMPEFDRGPEFQEEFAEVKKELPVEERYPRATTKRKLAAEAQRQWEADQSRRAFYNAVGPWIVTIIVALGIAGGGLGIGAILGRVFHP